MHKTVQRITSLLMILGILVSSTGIGIAKHYCGGTLKDIVFYNDSCCCEETAQNETQEAECEIASDCCIPAATETSDCCAQTPPAAPEDTNFESDCCDVQMELVKIDLEVRQTIVQQLEVSSPLLQPAFCDYTLELEAAAPQHFLNRSFEESLAPPMQGRSLSVVQQSFLL